LDRLLDLRKLTTSIAVATFAVALFISVWGLDLFARTQFTAHLRDQAAHALALASLGQSPYRWQFRTRDDLVAERVFGASNYEFDDDDLIVDSDGAPFEIGLRLLRQMSLQTIGTLHIHAHVDVPSSVRLILREHLGDGEHSSNAIDLAPSMSDIEIPIDALHWYGAHNDSVSAPKFAAMFRLQFALPRGSRLQLKSASLEHPKNSPRIDLSRTVEIVDFPSKATANTLAVYRIALNRETRSLQLTSSNRSPEQSAPLVLIPDHGRVEQKMALITDAYAAMPDAIAIPEDALAETFVQARQEVALGAKAKSRSSIQWSFIALYGALLLFTRLKPAKNARLRAFCEVALTLLGPLWLILGGYFDGSLHKPQVVLIGMTLAYAISLSVSHTWRWNGSARAWWLALAVAAIAAVIGLMLYRSDNGINVIAAKQTIRYAGWALLQQYLLCAICAERWRIVTGRALAAIYLGALGFAFLHSPNAALMIVTFAGGLCWCALYLRERALLPLAVSHALSALILLALVPRDILHSAEVSVRFFF
jgi:hypothetical protein